MLRLIGSSAAVRRRYQNCFRRTICYGCRKPSTLSMHLDQHCLIVKCTVDVATLPGNVAHWRLSELPAAGGTTPLEGDDDVFVGLNPAEAPVFIFGAGNLDQRLHNSQGRPFDLDGRGSQFRLENHSHEDCPQGRFQLGEDAKRRHAGLSREQLRLVFQKTNFRLGKAGPLGVWMVYDRSRRGSIVNGESIAGRKAQVGNDHLDDHPDRVALHPEQENLIQVPGLDFSILVGSRKPKSYVDASPVSLGLASLDLHSNRSASTRSTSVHFAAKAVRMPPADGFHQLSFDRFHQAGFQLFIKKVIGQYFLGQTFNLQREKSARERFNALQKVLEQGKGDNLLPFTEYGLVDNHFTIFTPCWERAWLLSECEDDLTNSDLSFIFADVVSGLDWLHECEVVVCDLTSHTIMVQLDSPPRARIVGFSEARWKANAPDTWSELCSCLPVDTSSTRNISPCVDLITLSNLISLRCPRNATAFVDAPTIHCINATLDPTIYYETQSVANTARLIHRLNDGGRGLPFQEVQMVVEFPISYFRKESLLLVRRADLTTLLDFLTTPNNVVSYHQLQVTQLHDANRESEAYCDATAIRRSLNFWSPESGADRTFWHQLTTQDWLNPLRLARGFSETTYSFNVPLSYHPLSSMVNVSVLLRTLSRETAWTCTLDVRPQKYQNVVAHPRWAGTYVDLQTFVTLQRRVQEYIAVDIEWPELASSSAPTYFASDPDIYLMPTDYRTLLFVALATGKNPPTNLPPELPLFITVDSLLAWSRAAMLGFLVPTIGPLLDWKRVPRSAYLVADENASIPASSIRTPPPTPTRFTFSKPRRAARAEVKRRGGESCEELRSGKIGREEPR